LWTTALLAAVQLYFVAPLLLPSYGIRESVPPIEATDRGPAVAEAERAWTAMRSAAARPAVADPARRGAIADPRVPVPQGGGWGANGPGRAYESEWSAPATAWQSRPRPVQAAHGGPPPQRQAPPAQSPGWRRETTRPPTQRQPHDGGTYPDQNQAEPPHQLERAW
jgi:hypothetical protein